MNSSSVENQKKAQQGYRHHCQELKSLGIKEKLGLSQEKKLRSSFTYCSDLFAMNIPQHKVLLQLKSQILSPDAVSRSLKKMVKKTPTNKWKEVQAKNKSKRLRCWDVSPLLHCNASKRMQLMHTQANCRPNSTLAVTHLGAVRED